MLEGGEGRMKESDLIQLCPGAESSVEEVPRSSSSSSFNGVSLGSSPLKGVTVLADTEFHSGEVILQEDPVVCIQMPQNQDTFSACDYCLRAVGVGVAESLRGEFGEDSMSWIESLEFPFLVEHQPEHCQHDGIRCHSCKKRYCSERCRAVAWNQYHRLMCYDPEDYEHPIAQLEESARLYNNPNPLMIAKLIATIIQRDQQDVFSRLSPADKEVSVPPLSLSPFTSFAFKGELQFDRLERDLQEVFVGQGELLAKALNTTGSPRYEHLFTGKSIAEWTSVVNVNQQLVAPVSAFDIYWNKLHSSYSPDSIELKKTYLNLSRLLDELEKKDISRISSVMGCAVYPRHHFFNHSCAPNARIRFVSDNAQISVVALNSISVGDEVCISYLAHDEQRLSSEERRKLLFDSHSFVCSCCLCG